MPASVVVDSVLVQRLPYQTVVLLAVIPLSNCKRHNLFSNCEPHHSLEAHGWLEVVLRHDESTARIALIAW